MKKLTGVFIGIILILIVALLGYKAYKVTPEELVSKDTMILSMTNLSDKKIKEYTEFNNEILKRMGISSQEKIGKDVEKVSKYIKKNYVIVNSQGQIKVVADAGIWYFIANVFYKEELKDIEKEIEESGFKLVKYRGLYVVTDTDDEIIATKDTNKKLLDYVKQNRGKEDILAVDINPIFKLFYGKNNNMIDLIGMKVDIDKKNIKGNIEILLTENFAKKFANNEEAKIYPEIKDSSVSWVYLSVGDMSGIVKNILEYYPYSAYIDDSELSMVKGVKELYVDENRNGAINIVDKDNREYLKEVIGLVEKDNILYFGETQKNIKFKKKKDNDLFLKGEVVDPNKNFDKIEFEGKKNKINVHMEITRDNLLKLIDENL